MNKIELFEDNIQDVLKYEIIVDIINNCSFNDFNKTELLWILNKLFKFDPVSTHNLDTITIFLRSKYNFYIDNIWVKSRFANNIDDLLSKDSLSNYLCDLHSKATFFVTKLSILNNLFPNRKPWTLTKVVNDYFVVSEEKIYYFVKEIVSEKSSLIVKSSKNYEYILWLDGKYIYKPLEKVKIKYLSYWYYLLDKDSQISIIDSSWFVFCSFDSTVSVCWIIKDSHDNIFRLLWKGDNEELTCSKDYFNLIHDLGVLSFNWNYDEIISLEYINWTLCLKWTKNWASWYFNRQWVQIPV